MNPLFEFQGDVYAADAVAAVVVYPPNEDEEEESWTISVFVRGTTRTVDYYEDEEGEARRTQLQLVTAWKDALARTLD